MDSLSFDTTFLIDYQRERKRGAAGAHDFLKRHRDASAYLSVVAYGEYAEGFEDVLNVAFLSVAESFEVIPVSAPIAQTYGRITRSLRKEGRLIGANDLWIAATAITENLPLVTRNLEHFARIPDLRLMNY